MSGIGRGQLKGVVHRRLLCEALAFGVPSDEKEPESKELGEEHSRQRDQKRPIPEAGTEERSA